ncbi:uncharacterized protein SAPINGB_P003630 [Magnusiomyces paraingens]|uniref:F-box domain-containing protein n=1 Tax=Magnusiomyces paraingens TaxID=2606893 RepID=A0A5E8BSL5_9ASCO|nr:uncharacterized protein SAPINGB_P003630 [Saprochaete ingens]VVT53549.1 unnamed protein product [Saprochaete ingens]
MDRLSALPDELLWLILLAHLDISDWQTLALVSHRFRSLVQDPRLHKSRRLLAAHSLDDALANRPSPVDLYRRNVLLSPNRLAPGAEPNRTYMLLTLPRRQSRDRLARALANRPSREELCARGLVPPASNIGVYAAQTIKRLERRSVENLLASFLNTRASSSIAVIAIQRRTNAEKIEELATTDRSVGQSSSLSFNALRRQALAEKNGCEYFVRTSVSALVSMYSFTAALLAAPPPPRAPPLPPKLANPNCNPTEQDITQSKSSNSTLTSVSAIKRKFELLAQQSYSAPPCPKTPQRSFVECRKKYFLSSDISLVKTISRSASSSSLSSETSSGSCSRAQGPVAALRQHFISLSC